MKKIIIVSLILNIMLYAEENSNNVAQKNIYERTCLPCHRYLPSSLGDMYMRYLKTFSGEQTFKASLKAFLKEPLEQTSVMSNLFIDRFSVKDKSLLNDKQLDEAIDIYWNLYNVRNKLK
jgi:hypothetical protein